MITSYFTITMHNIYAFWDFFQKLAAFYSNKYLKYYCKFVWVNVIYNVKQYFGIIGYAHSNWFWYRCWNNRLFSPYARSCLCMSSADSILCRSCFQSPSTPHTTHTTWYYHTVNTAMAIALHGYSPDKMFDPESLSQDPEGWQNIDTFVYSCPKSCRTCPLVGCSIASHHIHVNCTAIE